MKYLIAATETTSGNPCFLVVDTKLGVEPIMCLEAIGITQPRNDRLILAEQVEQLSRQNEALSIAFQNSQAILGEVQACLLEASPLFKKFEKIKAILERPIS